MLTFFLMIAMLIIGFLSGVIAIIAICVKQDNDLIAKHPQADVTERFPEVGILFRD